MALVTEYCKPLQMQNIKLMEKTKLLNMKKKMEGCKIKIKR